MPGLLLLAGMRFALALLRFRFASREMGGGGFLLRTLLRFFPRRRFGRNPPRFRLLRGLDSGKPLGLFF
ncbi:MAG: hypothetical protein ACO1SX_25975, partial [Actinomycetota bacterium]